MSRWTHVIGCFELSAGVYKVVKKNGEYKMTIPYPEEQFFLEAVIPDNKGGLEVPVTVVSLPRIKPVIDKLIYNIMPSGEDKFDYYLIQDKSESRSSSSCFSYPCEEELFEKRLEEMYKDSMFDYKINKDKFNLDWIDYTNEFNFVVSDNIRYCSGLELMRAFEKLFSKFEENGIRVSKGIFQWRDEYLGDSVVFSVSKSFVGDTLYFTITKDGCVVAEKRVIREFNKKIKDFELKVEKTDNWDKLKEDLTV